MEMTDSGEASSLFKNTLKHATDKKYMTQNFNKKRIDI